MPIIVPVDLSDAKRLVTTLQREIASGVYDIKIDSSWVKSFSDDELILLGCHCESSAATVAEECDRENVLDRIARSEIAHWTVLKVARNPHTSATTLEFLSRNESEHVRRYVAGNPNTGYSILEMLSRDDDEYVRSAAATNPNISVQALEMLSRDVSSYVQAAVAANPATPEPILRQLLTHSRERKVQRALEQNPHLKKSIPKPVAAQPVAQSEPCFIATACFLDKNAPEVCRFRDFRETYLRPWLLGRMIIRLYNSVSPPIALWLRARPHVAGIIRDQFLRPLSGALPSGTSSVREKRIH